MKSAIAALLIGVITLSAAADGTSARPLKLKGVKGEKPVFMMDGGQKDPKAKAMRMSGKAWSSAQITHDGAGIRLKKDMKQMLTGVLPLANRSFSCSVWIRPVTVLEPYSMVVANTTRPPCWGIRLFPVKPEGSFCTEVYYNWGVKGIPGQLMRAKEKFQTGSWYFYTLTVDREKGVMSFYIDGKLIEEAKMPKEMPAFRELFTVSSNPWFLDAQIYDLNFRPDVLSADQIAAQFEEGGKVLKDAKK